MKEYKSYLIQKEKEHELLCKKCGLCCGAKSDPCIHLKSDSQSQYFCDIYHQRWGTHGTIQGNTFQCVPIRNILFENWKGSEQCGYVIDALKANQPVI